MALAARQAVPPCGSYYRMIYYLPVVPDQASSDLLILRLFSLCLK
jgi:hypothetical protein